MASPLWPHYLPITDDNHLPIDGAKLKFFEPGTTTPLTVYSDEALTASLGTTVTCDAQGYPASGGSPVSIWSGVDGKLVVTDAVDVTLRTIDPITGDDSTATVTQYIGDTANANMTLGLTINQGGADDEILSFKSSDVAHGITAITETDTYASFDKVGANDGGLRITGLTETSVPFSVAGVATTEVTTDTSASTGAIYISPRLKSGAGASTHGDTANIFAVANQALTRMLIKGNGDMHITNTTLVALDGYDDVALVRTFERETREQGIVDHPLDNQIVYSRKHLEEAGVLRGDFLNVQSWMAMSGGAIWQLATGLDDVNRRLSRLEA